MHHKLFLLFAICVTPTVFLHAQQPNENTVRRVGIIGTTTSHVPAFTDILNKADNAEPLSRYKITAAFPGGMPDNPDSWDRLPTYLDNLKERKIDIYPTIEAMLPNVDCVMILSVDGRPHLEQARPVIEAGKPLFMDKPGAGSLADLLEIFRLANEKNVPIFTSSSLRFGDAIQKIKSDKDNQVVAADTFSPCVPNDNHPFFYWYGIHGIEMLFALMDSDCVSATTISSPYGDVITGLWNDGRIGTFRGIRNGARGYGATVLLEKSIQKDVGYEGYAPLVKEICLFFDTGNAPITQNDTIAVFAFMDAAEKSMNENGRTVTLNEVVEKAKSEKHVPARITIPKSFDGNRNTMLKCDDKDVELAGLSQTLENYRSGDLEVVVKVILHNEGNVPIENVRLVTDQLKNAYLALYVYSTGQ